MHGSRGRLRWPVPDSYFADWDGDGGGRGVVVMEDLGMAPGQFGHSTHHLGVDGVGGRNPVQRPADLAPVGRGASARLGVVGAA